MKIFGIVINRSLNSILELENCEDPWLKKSLLRKTLTAVLQALSDILRKIMVEQLGKAPNHDKGKGQLFCK